MYNQSYSGMTWWVDTPSFELILNYMYNLVYNGDSWQHDMLSCPALCWSRTKLSLLPGYDSDISYRHRIT
jgi:hypothetical protein